jgi:hypothetical protein
MSRGKYAGQPYSFRCPRCKQCDSVWWTTGRTRTQRSVGSNYHNWGDVAVEYVCRCGHRGWSRHPEVVRIEALRAGRAAHSMEKRRCGMSLDVSLMETKPCEVFWKNITHNLNEMAEEAGIYEHLWRPDEIGITKAKQLIEPLKAGLETLKADPERFKRFNPSNGWGDYEGLVEFVESYIQACSDHPDADVEVSR